MILKSESKQCQPPRRPSRGACGSRKRRPGARRRGSSWGRAPSSASASLAAARRARGCSGPRTLGRRPRHLAERRWTVALRPPPHRQGSAHGARGRPGTRSTSTPASPGRDSESHPRRPRRSWIEASTAVVEGLAVEGRRIASRVRSSAGRSQDLGRGNRPARGRARSDELEAAPAGRDRGRADRLAPLGRRRGDSLTAIPGTSRPWSRSTRAAV